MTFCVLLSPSQQYENTFLIFTKMTVNINKRKRNNWTEAEEWAMLDLWEENIRDLRKCKRNSHVYAHIAGQLGTHSGEEVHNKINNFTQKYRSEKKLVGFSGGSPSVWKYYDKVHKILGSFKSNNLEMMEESFLFEYDDMSIMSASVSTQFKPAAEEVASPSGDMSSRPPGISSPLTSEYLREVPVQGFIGNTPPSVTPPPSSSSTSTSSSSSRCRPGKKNMSTTSIQKEALTIAKENQNMMRDQIEFSKEVMKEQLQCTKRSLQLLEKHTEFASKIVEVSEKQIALQKEFMTFMKEVLKK